jgi:putative hydrolase of the HAD superfamily
LTKQCLSQIAKVSSLDSWTVFDLDDTLYLERDYVASGFKAISEFVSQTIGAHSFFDFAIQVFNAGEKKYTFQRTLDLMQIKYEDKLIQDFIYIYRTHTPSISLTKDSANFLREIRRVSRLGLITGGHPNVQIKKIRELGLEGVFEFVVYSGELGTDFDKPHPWSFQKFEELSGAKNSKITYFGDNPIKDLPIPISLGWNVRRIRRIGGLYSTLESLLPVVELQEFNKENG